MKRSMDSLEQIYSHYPNEAKSGWVIKFNDLLGTANIGVHIVHTNQERGGVVAIGFLVLL